MTFPRLPHAAFVAALATAALTVPSAAQERVGVTGAVNPLSTVERRGDVQSIVIGGNVLFEDRIITSDAGLVQVLFVDGSTFTVGAGARVVIDEFVFDPATNAGSLVAEVTSGALRFVGGRLSKGGNTVRFRTPGGTLGVRGAIVNIDLQPGCLPDGRCPDATASLVFGVEMLLTLPGGETRRIHTAGYSFVIFGSGADAQVEIVPTSTLDQSSLQARLAGRSGTSGGSDRIPTDADVEASGIASVNSGRAPLSVLPRPKPIILTSVYSPSDRLPGPDPTLGIAPILNEVKERIMEPADADALRGEVARALENDGEGPPFPTDPAVGGFLTPGRFVTPGGIVITDPGRVGIVTRFDLSEVGSELIFGEEGVVEGLRIGEDVLPFPATIGETPIAPFFSQTFSTEVEGTVIRGPDDFALYYLTAVAGELAQDDSAYFLTGTPTETEVLLAPTGETTVVRRYAFSDDLGKRRQGIRSELRLLNPLVAREFGTSLERAVETDFLIVQPQVAGGVAQTFYAGLLIDGSGSEQRSAINLDTGFIDDVDGELVLVGHRRGSYRLNAGDAAAVLTGATGTLTTDEGGGIFGEDGDSFVYGGGSDEETGNVFLDRMRGPAALDPEDRFSLTTQLARLTGIIDADTLTRSTRTITGFAAGIIEPDGLRSYGYRSTSVGDFRIDFDAEAATLGGVIGITDIFGADPAVRSYNLAFGTDIFGGASSTTTSTYVDDDTFGAVATTGPEGTGSPQTTVTLEDGRVIPHADAVPDTYMVSADAVPQPELFAEAGVTPCECRFMEWGWWGTGTDFDDESLPEDREDFAHLGTFVAGDITRDADLPTTGTASYEGHAVGNVVARQEDGSNDSYVAAGDLGVSYDFGARVGEIEITNFDGRDFGGTVAGSIGADGESNMFSGTLAGSGLRGTTDGSFARGPLSPVQGVLGSFDVQGAGYRAVGSYLGELQAP